MERLKSLDDFKHLQDRIATGRRTDIPTIVLAAGTCGQASGANDLIRITKRELIARGMTDRVHLRITGCHGWCEMEPSVRVEPHGTFYPKVGMGDMARIVSAVLSEEVVEDLLYVDPESGKRIALQSENFVTAHDLKLELGSEEYAKIPTGAIGLYTYYERLAQGLRQLMAGNRKFTLETVHRDDLACLTHEAAEISGLTYVMDVDRDEVNTILGV